MYKEYKPNILLAPYVETYWVYDANQNCPQTVRVLPDGCVDILFNCTEDYDSNMAPFVPYIIGAMTSFSDRKYDRKARIIGVRFHPCAIAAFTKVPVCEFTNDKVDTRLFQSLFSDFISEQLFGCGNETEQIHCIENYLLSKFGDLYGIDKQIVGTVKHIQATKGFMPINDLLNNVCLCQRQFERKFKNLTGITPKMFSAITRYAETKNFLKSNPNKSLFSTALECGYYDHSHLIRDFKRFGGTLPLR